MAYGFGQTIDTLKATELQMVAHCKGYGTRVTDNVVAIEANDGTQVTVIVKEGKYIVNRTDKHMTYKSANAVMKGINKTFEVIRSKSNGQYD